MVNREDEERALELLRANLHPTLDFWRDVNGGNQLTMQHFLKSAHFNERSRHTKVLGVKDNKVFRLDKDGEERYSNAAMVQEVRRVLCPVVLDITESAITLL